MDASPAIRSSHAAARGTRAFFALVPDAGVRAELARLARQWAQQARGRPSSTESIHLTLAFIGEVDAFRLALLEAVGGRVPGGAFDLDLDRVGDFRAARVAWIAPSAPPEALYALQRALVAALAGEGFPIDRRSFRAHLTLARHCSAPVAATAIPTVRWPVSRFALMASTLDPAGARYRELAGWDLQASPSSPASCS